MLERIDLESIVTTAQKAGDAIMEIYHKDFTVSYKDDRSPLTEADTLSNKIICTELEEKYPDIPILSEENKEVPYEVRKHWEYFWLIDPIDGTKEFIKKNGEFTVNIALIHKDTPVLGVVYAPALGDMYKAKKGEGAFKNNARLPLRHNDDPKNHITIVASKSHLSEETQTLIDRLTSDIAHATFISKGSSLKLVMVAEGSADIYPRLAPTMEWDTAAADAIIRESGKITYRYDTKILSIHSLFTKTNQFESIKYNKKELLNPWFITTSISELRK